MCEGVEKCVKVNYGEACHASYSSDSSSLAISDEMSGPVPDDYLRICTG